MQTTPVPFRPALQGVFAFRFYQTIHRAIAEGRCADAAGFADLVRGEIAWSWDDPAVNPTQRKMYRTCWLVLRDLQRIGWRLAWQRNTLCLTPPRLSSLHLSPSQILEQKRLVQNAMAHARLARIHQYAEFVRRMERPPAKGLARRPVGDLVADGPALAAEMRAIAAMPSADGRGAALRQSIRPYLQLVHEKARCAHTGHLLSDIWRYFRFTWSNPPEPTPGRTMLYLVRDAARPLHPVMGLFSLENAALRIRCRDHHLGWTPESLAERLLAAPDARALRRELQRIVTSIEDCLGDVDASGLCRPADLAAPTPAAIDRLTRLGRQADADRADAVTAWLNWDQDDGDERPRQSKLGNISVHAERALYRRKRAAQLARLLDARPLRRSVEGFVAREEGQAALRSFLVAQKNRHIGTSMLELNVCGAVPPYNHLLGGKLAALLALSPTVVEDYRLRYGDRPSEIASLMKGEPVIRPADLVYLGTTSLYVAGSSQYNRLKLPPGLFPEAGFQVEWVRLGETEGYGTMHIGQDTIAALDDLVRSTGVRRTNHVFGEGASPKFRTVRAGLEEILEPGQRPTANALARHAMRRIVYGAWLASNGQEYLAGEAASPAFYFGRTPPAEGTRQLIDFWIDRWLAVRLDHGPSLDALERFRPVDLRVSRALGPQTDGHPATRAAGAVP